VFAQQPRQQPLSLGPVAEVALGIDMPGLADIDEMRTPVASQRDRGREGAIGVVAAGDEEAGKGQGAARTRAEARQPGIAPWPLHIGRRDQQRADHGMTEGGLLELRPPGDGHAAQAVRDQHDRPAGPVDREIELVDPGVAMRGIPHAQVDAPMIGVFPLPMRLPVIRAAVVDARYDENRGIPANAVMR
jgi:hypothetical protein